MSIPVSSSNGTANLITELFGDVDAVQAAQAAQNVARQACRHAVAEVADNAKAALPDSTGRVDAAAKMVLAGDVELLPDGTAKVASQANGTMQYFVVNGICECKDFPKAPQGFCKHRLAYGIAKRALPLVTASLDAGPLEAPPEPLEPPPVAAIAPATCPEALFSITLKGRSGGHEVLLTTRGQSWAEFEANVRRLNGMLDAPAAPTVHQVSSPDTTPQATTAREEWCSVHETAMSWNEGTPRGWFSHKTDDARYPKRWCKGTLPRARR